MRNDISMRFGIVVGESTDDAGFTKYLKSLDCEVVDIIETTIDETATGNVVCKAKIFVCESMLSGFVSAKLMVPLERVHGEDFLYFAK